MPGNAFRRKAEVVALQRIVEQVRGVEAGIAQHALRIDGQPAARAEQDVVVVEIAVKGANVPGVIEKMLRNRGRLRIGRRRFC